MGDKYGSSPGPNPGTTSSSSPPSLNKKPKPGTIAAEYQEGQLKHAQQAAFALARSASYAEEKAVERLTPRERAALEVAARTKREKDLQAALEEEKRQQKEKDAKVAKEATEKVSVFFCVLTHAFYS